MNKLLIILGLTSTIQVALACDHSEDKLCPGDVVFSDTNYRGIVEGLNKSNGKVNVLFTRNPEGDALNIRALVDIKYLSLTKGCIDEFCVGQTVFSDYSYRGIIEGVNKNSGKVNVLFTRNPEGATRNIRALIDPRFLSLTKGCVAGFCVGDKVISDTSYLGFIEGVNKKSGKLNVIFIRNAEGEALSIRALVAPKYLSITNECAKYSASDRK